MISGNADFIIAMPSLKESVFAHSVILMAEHHKEGALGCIVNLPTGTSIRDALKMMKIKNESLPDIPILFGGPVQTDFFWLIHSTRFMGQSTIRIHPTFSLSSAMEILPILGQDYCPEIYHAGIGYAGWGAQQLEREIEEGSWWEDEFNVDLLFGTPYSDQWGKAFEILGVNPDNLYDPADPSDPVVN